MEPAASRGRRVEKSDVDSLRNNLWLLIANSRRDWPAVEELQSNHSGRLLYAKHDGPHVSAKIEWWYVNGHFGPNEQYSVFAAFFRLAVFENGAITHAHAANWALIDSKLKTYTTHSLLDPSTPKLLSQMIDSDEYHGDVHVLRALKELFESGRVLAPDSLMKRQAVVSAPQDPLSLDFDGQVFRVMPCEDPAALPVYELVLQDGHRGNRLQLQLQPRQPAALHGKDGIVSTGHSEEDMFYYFSPLCNVVRGSVSIQGAAPLDVGAGRFWIDHEFGGVSPCSQQEAAQLKELAQNRGSALEHSWEWAAIQLNNASRDAISVTLLRNMNDGGRVVDLFAIHQDGQTGISRRIEATDGVELTADKNHVWKSPVTGMAFPTKWTVVVPLRSDSVLRLTLTADFADQEFVTLPGKPSYWEGRVTVAGTLSGEAITGIGFMECHGERDLHAVAGLFQLMQTMLCAPVELLPSPTHEALAACELTPLFPLVLASVEQAAMLTMMTTGKPMPQLHKDVLRNFFAAYLILHHRNTAADAIAAFESAWKQLTASLPTLDFPTLILRAFTMRALESKSAAALRDADVTCNQRDSEAKHFDGSLKIPTEALLSSQATDEELAVVSRLASGMWNLDKSKPRGSISDFLAAEGVGMVARMLCGSITPDLRTVLNRDSCTLETDIITSLSTTKSIVKLDGSSWVWESFGRGQMTSRGCLSVGSDGCSCVITVVTPLLAPSTDIEYKWVVIRSDGTMTETMHLMEKGNLSTPKAIFEQHFIKKL